MKLFKRSIILFGVASFVSLASAQTTTWQGTASSQAFENASNWSAGLPNNTTGAIVDTSVTINQTSAAQSAQTFAFQGGGTINLNLSGGSILTLTGATPSSTSTNSTINGGTTVNFSGGTLMFNDGIFNVGDTGGAGTLNLQSGTLNYDVQTVADGTQINVGNAGTGTVTQSGTSTVTTGDVLFVGTQGGTGNYNLTGNSSLQTGSKLANYVIAVGADTDAGTVGTNGTMTISNSATLTLNRGAQLQIGTDAIPFPTLADPTPTAPASVHATGVFTQNGAFSNVTAVGTALDQTAIFVGTATGGTGTYDLQAGHLTIGDNAALIIGEASGSTGIFNQTGGTTDIVDILFVGDQAGSVGTYTQSAGTFTGEAGSLVNIGESGQGTYNLSGGTADFMGGFTVGDQAGSHGTFNQTGGVLTAEDIVEIGNSGAGTYNLSSGTATFNNGLSVGSAGVVNLTGGTLQTGSISGSAGAFNFGGGTLRATGSNIMDSLKGTVIGNSTLDTTTNNITLNGVLSGPGGFTLIGNHAVTLGGANSFAGAININGGTLNASTANLLSNPINIGAAGTFNLTPTVSATDTFGGNITGAGNFSTGTNTEILTGAINVTGTTTIGGGTLESGNATFGNINGTGGFIVGGAPGGIVNFTGNNTFAGGTTVNAGYTLIANNLTGSLTNNGIVNLYPNNPYVPGTFTIGGNLTSPGTLNVHTTGVGTDLYQVGGTANLGGGTIALSGFGTSTTPLTVVSAGALAGAAPQLLVAGAQVLFTATLLPPSGNTYQVATLQLPTAGFDLTPNQTAVSGALDPVLVNPTLFYSAPVPSFVAIATGLNNLTAAQIPGALDQLSPESLQYSRGIAFENATFLAEHLNGHLATLRSGYSGLDTSGLSMVMPGFESSLGRSLGSLLAYNPPAPNGVDYYSSDLDSNYPISDKRTMSDSSNPLTSPSFSNSSHSSSSPLISPNFSEFVSGDVILADLNRDQSTANSPPNKASYTAGDVTAGISFRMNSSLAAGVLFDYNHTDAKTDANGSKTKVDSYSPGLFATFFQDGYYFNGLFSYGYNQYSNNRNLNFGGLSSTANSSPSGGQYVGNFDFGYDFKPDKHWILGPTLGVTYTHLDIDSFNETGAGAADLSVNTQHADSVRSRLGSHVVYQFHSGPFLFQPNFTAAWQHEYLDDSSGITSQFNIPGSSPFTIQTAAPSRDSALLGLGVTATLDNSMALYLNYLIDVGAQDYLAQSVEGGFKARF